MTTVKDDRILGAMADKGAFEWTFVVDSLDGPGDARIDRLYELLDASVGSHAGLPLVTAAAEGETAIGAAHAVIRALTDSGFAVTRSHPDLVTRPEISERAGVSRQAVSHWLKGRRHYSQSFPPPINAAGGGVWLWSDVNAWLAKIVKSVSDDPGFPTLSDHVFIDSLLMTWPRSAALLSPFVGTITESVVLLHADETISMRPEGNAAAATITPGLQLIP